MPGAGPALPGRPSLAPQLSPPSRFKQSNAASPVPGRGNTTPYQQQTQSAYNEGQYASSQARMQGHQPPSAPSNPRASSYNHFMSTGNPPAQSSSVAGRPATTSSTHPTANTTPTTYQHQPLHRHQQQSQHHPQIQSAAMQYSSPASAPNAHYPTSPGQPRRPIPSAFIMSDAANASIPAEIRSQFPCDEKGRVLWFVTPPVDGRSMTRERLASHDSNGLSHSAKYLAARERRRAMIEETKKGRKRDWDEEGELGASSHGDSSDSLPSHSSAKRNRTSEDEGDVSMSRPSPSKSSTDATTERPGGSRQPQNKQNRRYQLDNGRNQREQEQNLLAYLNNLFLLHLRDVSTADDETVVKKTRPSYTSHASIAVRQQ